MWSILCLVALFATVFGSFNPNEPNPYQDWIPISIANQPGQQKLGYAVTKDAALLAKHNGTVVHKVVTNGAFSTHELKDERAYLCPIPGYLTGGANGLLYDSTYPKNIDGFSYVCSQYFYSTEKGRKFWAVNVEPSKNTTIAFPRNEDFVLYFVGAKSPNKERKFNFAVQNNE
ncbi:unnamed protein product, partial [Mesorhabditis spiculigera]